MVAQTTTSGFAVCCGFALLPLLRVRRISPAATLRQPAALDGVTGGLRAWPVYLLLATMLTLLALVNAPDWKRALAMVAGLGAAFGSLVAVAHGLILAALRFIRPTWPYLVRQGISNLHRPQTRRCFSCFPLASARSCSLPSCSRETFSPNAWP
jgi:putative ABC transport system permease protein